VPTFTNTSARRSTRRPRSSLFLSPIHTLAGLSAVNAFAVTVSVAVLLVAPVPAFVELTAPVVLSFPPAEVAVTSTAMLHDSPAGIDPLLRLIAPLPNAKVLGKISSTGGREVLAPNLAAEVTYAMEAVIQYGTGTAANIGRPAAGKTGTAENYQDAWFCGFVPQLATCVWVGYPAGEISLQNIEGVGTVFGGTLPAEIWHNFMGPAVEPWPVKALPGTLGAPLPTFGGDYWSGVGTYYYPYTPTPATTTTTPATTH